MPVKVDNCFNLSTHPSFDCDVLSELKDISDDLSAEITDICLSPCEDIWKKFDDFLLTPPQSPPVRLDLVSDLLDFNETDSLGLGLIDSSVVHNVDVLHDCMWSGLCVEDNTNTCLNHNTCSTSAVRICGRTHRPDTPVTALSSSPFAMNYTFNDLLSTLSDTSSEDMDDSQSSLDDDDLNSCGDSSHSSSSSSTSFAKVKESLINDHSYGGSLVISHQNSTQTKNISYETQSLIHPKHKVSTRSANNKIKCHKINGKRIKIIKANQPLSSCTNNTPKESTDSKPTVPTVRIIRNEKHFIKAKACIENNGSKDEQKCKFSTRRKASTVSSERKVMFAQNNPFLKSKPIERLSHSDEEAMSGCEKSSKVPPMRRREHNDSERKRRDHLRNAFVNLKDQIPKLKSAEKRPPRIMILHEATSYVLHLNDKQRYLERTLNSEVEKREKLLKILSNEMKTEMK